MRQSGRVRQLMRKRREARGRQEGDFGRAGGGTGEPQHSGGVFQNCLGVVPRLVGGTMELGNGFRK